MQVLLDTHAFLWWVTNDSQLSERAHDTILSGSNELFLSAASGWEIAIKAQIGKLRLPENLAPFITDQLHRNNIAVLPIHLRHTLHIYTLPLLHRDPFDRLLVAQSQQDKMPIVTVDPLIAQYEVETLW
jgi:PIN domain nuclease of toxin-antitoxin system